MNKFTISSSQVKNNLTFYSGVGCLFPLNQSTTDVIENWQCLHPYKNPLRRVFLFGKIAVKFCFVWLQKHMSNVDYKWFLFSFLLFIKYLYSDYCKPAIVLSASERRPGHINQDPGRKQMAHTHTNWIHWSATNKTAKQFLALGNSVRDGATPCLTRDKAPVTPSQVTCRDSQGSPGGTPAWASSQRQPGKNLGSQTMPGHLAERGGFKHL